MREIGEGNRRAQQIWSAALGELELALPSSAFATWLRGTVGQSVTVDKLVVGTPNVFTSEWLERRAYQLIQRTVSKVAGGPLDVDFRVSNQGQPSAAGAPRPRAAAAPGEPAPFYPGFPNRRYSFESFVVGPSNSLSYNAALAVATTQEEQYNPLFIYAGVGLGKTHLLHAIAHSCRQRSVNCLYVTSEQFTNDFITAIRHRSTGEFRSRYRSMDVLLMDDIQFMSGKEQTLEGFFHTFNDLHNTGRQIVITSDKQPSAMPYLEDRMRSRFAWGLTTDIQAPALETKIAILQAKSKAMGADAGNDVLTFIAERCRGSIRELEGDLTRVVATARVDRSPVSLALARRALGSASETDLSRLTPEQVLKAVSGVFQVDQAFLTGPKRRRELVVARYAAMYLMRKYLNLTVTQIGRVLGGRNHATVINGIKRVDSQLLGDPLFKTKVEAARELLAARS